MALSAILLAPPPWAHALSTPPRSVVDYALASRAAAPWLDGLVAEDPTPQLSDHCPLMLTLSLPGPPRSPAPPPTPVRVRWEPGA